MKSVPGSAFASESGVLPGRITRGLSPACCSDGCVGDRAAAAFFGVLGAFVAFIDEHERCGELDGGLALVPGTDPARGGVRSSVHRVWWRETAWRPAK